jgi:serine/threonine protein kinase
MRMIGPFEIGEPLARGGHAVVHLASLPSTQGDFVAKIAADGNELMLHRENAALRSVDHPNVIAPVGFVDDSVQAALFLPRAACSLRAQEGRLAASQVVHVALGIAGALDALHRAGIAHGDVSSGNVLLLDDGTPVLCDLGSAQRCTSAAADIDVAALARTACEALDPRDQSSLRPLLQRIAQSPVDAVAFADALRALDIDASAPDTTDVAPVVIEPPTLTL